MALQSVAGLPGYAYGMVSSMNNRAIGKFTDSNHLSTIWQEEPADYDKKLIEVYTQTQLVANDFLAMINKSTPYFIKGNTDSFSWDVELPYEYTKLIEVPSDTANASRVGIDGQEFTLVFESNEWAMNSIIGSDLRHGQQFTVVKDPIPHNSGFLYTLTLNTENPRTDYVDKRWIAVGTEYQLISGTIGEFTQDLLGLRRPGKKMRMFESLGSAVGWEHTNTGWADARVLRDSKTGSPLDITWYAKQQRNGKPITMSDIKWEPTIERMLRQEAMDLKVSKMIWQKPGTAKDRGALQELKKISGGVYHKMHEEGHLVQYNRGEFSPNIFRTVFGDLFYRRVDYKNRRVRIYTNESGMQTFSQAMKEDAFGQGFTFNIGDGNRFMQGTGQNLKMNFGFDGMVTAETGEITLIHLKELDLPQTNTQFGPNRKTPPLYLVFNVSPESDGTLTNNIREVRHEGAPNMKWGYIDGRTHHLGHAASHGHSMANKFDGYTMTMDDRYDVFIEDLSRTAIIEELPQY